MPLSTPPDQPDWSLYLLLDMGVLGERNPLEVAAQARRGGATALQLRAKGWSARAMVELALPLAALARQHEVPLIINDDLAVAMAAGADGVHLGVDDLPLGMARRLWPDGLLGYSPEGVDDARRAALEGASYLGVGPFSSTDTKPDAGAPIGPAGLSAIVRAVDLPVVAVGGLGATTIPQAMAAGAAGVAVASAIIAAQDIEAVTRELRNLIYHGGTEEG